MAAMSWRRWKLGLLVGLFTGILDGGLVAFADPNLGWKPLLFLICVFVCKDGLMFLKQHPVEEITDNTEFIQKPKDNP